MRPEGQLFLPIVSSIRRLEAFLVSSSLGHLFPALRQLWDPNGSHAVYVAWLLEAAQVHEDTCNPPHAIQSWSKHTKKKHP